MLFLLLRKNILLLQNQSSDDIALNMASDLYNQKSGDTFSKW